MSVRIRRVICPVTLIAAERLARLEQPLVGVPALPAAQPPAPAGATGEMPFARPISTPTAGPILGLSPSSALPIAKPVALPVVKPVTPQPPDLRQAAAGGLSSFPAAISPKTPIPIGTFPPEQPSATKPLASPQTTITSGSGRRAAGVRRPVSDEIAEVSGAAPAIGFAAPGGSQAISAGAPGGTPYPAGQDNGQGGPVQMKPSRRDPGLPPFEGLRPAAIRALASAGGSGSQLAEQHRAAVEPVVGGLQDVRIHTGEPAAKTARALGAEAFTIGRDVFFAQGKFDPASLRGRALLAHELTHVRQQSDLGSEPVLGYGGEAGEAEAETAEQAVLSGVSATGGLTVGSYVRNYASGDGRPLSPGDRTRLDAISFRGLEVCRQMLGADLNRTSGEQIRRLTVDLNLDLASASDEQAAQIWGQALADKIRAAFGLGDEAARLERVIAAAETVQRSAADEERVELPVRPDQAQVKAVFQLIQGLMQQWGNDPNIYQTRAILSLVEAESPQVANAILAELQRWQIGERTAFEIVMGKLDDYNHREAEETRERWHRKGITAIHFARLPLSNADFGMLSALAAGRKGIAGKVWQWQQIAKPPKHQWEQDLLQSIEGELNKELPKLGVKSIGELAVLVNSFYHRFVQMARITAITMLDANEKLAFIELNRYHSGKRPPDDAEVVGLLKVVKSQVWPCKAELNRLEAELQGVSERVIRESAQQAVDAKGMAELLAKEGQLRQAVQQKRSEYEALLGQHKAMYPVLTAEDLDLQALANAAPEEAQKILAGPLWKILDNISETRNNLEDGSLDARTLPTVVAETKRQLGIEKGSALDEIADETVNVADLHRKGIQIAKMALAGLLGALAIFVPPAGVAVAAVAGAMTATSLYTAVESLEEYRIKGAAQESALDRANAIMHGEPPSLFWLALDIAIAVLDIALAAKAFREIGKVVKGIEAAESGKAAAHGGAEAPPRGGMAEIENVISKVGDEAKVPASKLRRLRNRIEDRIWELTRGKTRDLTRIKLGDWGEWDPRTLEIWLRENVDNPDRMIEFYKRIGKWENVKGLSGRIRPSLFDGIQVARDQKVAEKWFEVCQEVAKEHPGVQMKLSPYVGSPPGSAKYKQAFSDLDIVAQFRENIKTLPWSEQRLIEMEAMERMNGKLSALVGDSGEVLDVNVYLPIKELPDVEAAAAAGKGLKGLAGQDYGAVLRRQRFESKMNYFEMRMGCDEPAWTELRARTYRNAQEVDKGLKNGNTAAQVQEALDAAETRYANMQRRIGGEMGAGVRTEGEARARVRAEVEARMRAFLDGNKGILDDPKMFGTKAYQQAAADYENLQLEMRSVWPEAYVSKAGAKIGAASPAEGKALLTQMSGKEINQARLSQAAMIMHYHGKRDVDAFISAWKAGKYEMRDLTYLEALFGYLPENKRQWMEFLSEIKGMKTPDAAWLTWVERFGGNEEQAKAAVQAYLDELKDRTLNWTSKYLARKGVPGAPGAGADPIVETLQGAKAGGLPSTPAGRGPAAGGAESVGAAAGGTRGGGMKAGAPKQVTWQDLAEWEQRDWSELGEKLPKKYQSGGHGLGQHLEITDKQLQRRARTEKTGKFVSKFHDPNKAVALINNVIGQNGSQLQAFLARVRPGEAGRLELSATVGESIGYGYIGTKGGSDLARFDDLRNVVVVVFSDGAGGWVVRTAYPNL